MQTPDRSTVAAIRFGYGLRPGEAPPEGPSALLAQLRRPGGVRRDDDLPRRAAALGALRAAREASKTGDQSAAQSARRAVRDIRIDDVRQHILRPLQARDGFRERLVAFWADHFTVDARRPDLMVLSPHMIDAAIRPNITGRFADMLRAVMFHPAMLLYLDQASSIGPASPAGRRRGKGLNENLAREVLELHTLGATGSYTQTDVTELAKLLTGLSVNQGGFRFRQMIAEPGPETVLGKTYGGSDGTADIEAALNDLSVHPDTARHLAHKLLVHFVGPEPEPTLVRRMADRFRLSGGDLGALYEVMLGSDAAWEGFGAKVKTPHEFMVSALRAVDTPASAITALNARRLIADVADPLAAMGQPIRQPGAPDGWPEEAESWVTPAMLAARIEWAQGLAAKVADTTDPRNLVRSALADAASPALDFLVTGAESRQAGIALILASPEFNRR